MSRPARIALLVAGMVVLALSALLLIVAQVNMSGPLIERVLIQMPNLRSLRRVNMSARGPETVTTRS